MYEYKYKSAECVRMLELWGINIHVEYIFCSVVGFQFFCWTLPWLTLLISPSPLRLYFCFAVALLLRSVRLI